MATSAPSKTPLPTRGPTRLLLIEGEGETAEASADRIACAGCGGSFPAPDGAALHYALKGSCPRCGGDYRLRPAR